MEIALEASTYIEQHEDK